MHVFPKFLKSPPPRHEIKPVAQPPEIDTAAAMEKPDRDLSKMLGAVALLALSLGAQAAASAAPPVPIHHVESPQVAGLKAIPANWLPMGKSRAFFRTDSASDYLDVQRSPGKIVMKSSHTLNPDFVLTEMGDGQVKLKVKSAIPFASQTFRGEMQFRDNKLQIVSKSGRMTLSKSYDHTFDGVITDSKADSTFDFYTLPSK